jgi:hypothetical protein
MRISRQVVDLVPEPVFLKIADAATRLAGGLVLDVKAGRLTEARAHDTLSKMLLGPDGGASLGLTPRA